MRLELKMRNGPFVWLGFLLFIGLYVAGFDAWLSGWRALAHLDAVARRLLLAGTTFGALAYLMVFLEPKDRVHYRWLGRAFAKFQFGPALAGLQGWMTAALATLGVGIALLVWLGARRTDQATVGAMLGFLSRDMALVVLASMLSRRRGGDFAAIAILFALYILLPAIVRGLNYETAWCSSSRAPAIRSGCRRPWPGVKQCSRWCWQSATWRCRKKKRAARA